MWYYNNVLNEYGKWDLNYEEKKTKKTLPEHIKR